jgi:hypothetical protein
MLKEARKFSQAYIASRTHVRIDCAVLGEGKALVHVLMIVFIDEMTPFVTFRCQLVEGCFGSVGAGTALEMNDLIGCVSPANTIFRSAYGIAHHTAVCLEGPVAAKALVH